MKTCSQCGATNEDRADFCCLCWFRFENSAPGRPGPAADLTADPRPIDRAYSGRSNVAASLSAGDPGSAARTKALLDGGRVHPAGGLGNHLDLVGRTFTFFFENIGSYIALSLVFLGIMLATVLITGGIGFSSMMKILSAQSAAVPAGSTALNQNVLSSGSPVPAAGLVALWPLVGMITAIGIVAWLSQAAIMVATVDIAKGDKAGVLETLTATMKRAPALIAIQFMQTVCAFGPIFLGLGLSVVTGGSGTALLIGLALGVPTAVVLGLWFSLAPFIYLDQGVGGRQSLIVSKSLVARRSWAVFSRFFVFGLIVGGLQQIPLAGIVVSLAGASIWSIFAWLIYQDLKAEQSALTINKLGAGRAVSRFERATGPDSGPEQSAWMPP